MADISDTSLVSMVLVDDENNRTTFNGPIINDFTITEDLQSKITQLTTIANNISNLQTRLTNITNILNTQNIEFTDNVSDVSSAGSKLYIQPQVYLQLTNLSSYSDPVYRYLNLTPYVTGKYEFTGDRSLNVSCSLGLESNFNPNGWTVTLGPTSLPGSAGGLIVNVGDAVVDGPTENIGSITVNTTTLYENGALAENTASLDNNTIITITSDSGTLCTINIEFIK